MDAVNELQHRLGARLKALRQASGLTGRELARVASMSQSKISRMERGFGTLNVVDVAALLDVLSTDETVRVDVMALAREICRLRVPTESSPNLFAHPEGFVLAERSAQKLAVCIPDVIPALLQTEAYATGIISTIPVWTTDESRTESLVARLERQAQLANKERHFRFLIGWGSLMYRFTDPVKHCAQLNHLLSVQSRPNVEIRCLRPGTLLTRPTSGDFTVLDEDCVVIDRPSTTETFRGVSEVMSYLDVFDSLWAQASAGEQFAALIAMAIDLSKEEAYEFEQ